MVTAPASPTSGDAGAHEPRSSSRSGDDLRAREFVSADLACCGVIHGLGFVFAMWMAHESAAEAVRRIDFAGARDEGLARLEEIVAEYERQLKLPRAELRAYLTENICFDLNADMRAGLELFFQLAHKHGLTPALRPLQMLRGVELISRSKKRAAWRKLKAARGV